MVAAMGTPMAEQGNEGEEGRGRARGRQGGGGEHSLEVLVSPNEDPPGRQL
jgi:hypothetical protein